MTIALQKPGGGGPHLQDLHRCRKPARPSSLAWASSIWRSSWTVMLREFKVEATVGKPQVAYTRGHPQACQGRGPFYVRQTGGRGQYGHCWIELHAPGARHGLSSSRASIVGGVVSRESSCACPSMPVSRKRPSPASWAATKWWTSRQLWCDGSYHDVDSSEMAFKIAGSMAFKNAMAKGSPVLLEPMMKVEINRARAVHGRRDGRSRSSRRGRDRRHGSPRQRCADHPLLYVPLSRDVRLHHRLALPYPGPRRMFTMQFDHYEEVPKSVAEKLHWRREKNN